MIIEKNAILRQKKEDVSGFNATEKTSTSDIL